MKGSDLMKNKGSALLYIIIKGLVRLLYPRIQVQGKEYIPEAPAILVGNHAQMNGPIISELYIPGDHYTWCAGQMMHLKDVPGYAFEDFWSAKPKYIRWFYKLLSYIIAPFSVCIFNNANTIGVYHDTRIISTFKHTVEKLQSGSNVVIFPEHDTPYNHVIYEFQDRFIDVAKLYYKRTGKELSFVPFYSAPKLKAVYFGQPIRFCPENPAEMERKRICEYLMKEITEIACSLPEHTVIPYRNISKRKYPLNTQEEAYEKTGN